MKNLERDHLFSETKKFNNQTEEEIMRLKLIKQLYIEIGNVPTN